MKLFIACLLAILSFAYIENSFEAGFKWRTKINIRSDIEDYSEYYEVWDGLLQVLFTYVTDEVVDKTEWYYGNIEWEEDLSNWEDEERLVFDLEILHGQEN